MESALPGSTSQLTNHVVQAGAGAGKTRSLVEKVVTVFRHYQETQGRAPRLIVTTFTRKATQELRERLIVRACEEGDSQLLEYVGNARSLHISTIHGVLNLFLSQMGHLCNLEAGFRLIHDTEERQIARVALKKTLLQMPDYLLWMEEYSFQQILTVLMRFSKSYSEDPNIKPAGADDLEAAFLEAVEETKARVTAIAAEILEAPSVDMPWSEYAIHLQKFVENWDDSFSMWENRPEKPRKNKKSTLSEEFQEQIGKELKKVDDELKELEDSRQLWPQFVAKWDEFFDLGLHFHREFWSAKLNEGLLSLSDLEIFSLGVLRESPFLGTYFSAGWDFWLIDEYQDTSPIQAELLKRLRGSSSAFIVGDPQQSIYLFRGARSEIFHDQMRLAEQQNAIIESLRRNYRSKPEFLTFLNDFFHSYSEQFQPMQPRVEVEGASDIVARFISGPTEQDENQGILAHIAGLLEQGTRYDGICVLGRTHAHLFSLASILKEKGIPVQVHSPTGFWRRREVLDAMSLLKFLVHPHDDLSLLTLLRSPTFRIPDAKLADFTRLKRNMDGKSKSLWMIIRKDDSSVVRGLCEILEQRKELGLVATFERALRTSGMLELVFHGDPTGRREANLWKLLTRIKDEERKPGFQLLTLVEEVEGLLGAEEMKSEGDAITAQEPNCVNLMTIHSSKGLEFDHVILPRLGTAPNLSKSDTFSHHEETSLYSFPVYFADQGKSVSSPLDRRRIRELRTRELKEQDRWLYVAMTRAKQTIALCWSDEQFENNSWAMRGRLPQAERFSRNSKYKVAILRPPFVEMEKIKNILSGAQVRKPWSAIDTSVQRLQTVSQLAKHGNENASLKQMIARQRKAVYGIELHRALQTLKVRPDLGWAKKTHSGLADVIEFVWTAEAPPMEYLIRNGLVEWGFRIKTPLGLVQGRIDLWGRDQDGHCWIVDYKSGRAKDDESNWDQLKLYAWALKKLGQAEEVQLALIHPLEKKILVSKVGADDIAGVEARFN